MCACDAYVRATGCTIGSVNFMGMYLCGDRVPQLKIEPTRGHKDYWSSRRPRGMCSGGRSCCSQNCPRPWILSRVPPALPSWSPAVRAVDSRLSTVVAGPILIFRDALKHVSRGLHTLAGTLGTRQGTTRMCADRQPAGPLAGP